ncbi:MAG: MFS transporter [Candidatus Bathyarchaeia archaeon]
MSIYRNRNLQVIFGVTLMNIMGVSAISPALPKMASVLNVPAESIGLIIAFYTLPGVLLAPLIGMLADRLGRKETLIPCILLFGFAGIALYLAADFQLILALRFIQGIGGAGLASLAVTLIGDLFHGSTRIKAMGANASIISIGTASFPIIGGALGLLAWNLPFLLFVVAFPIAALAYLFLENPAVTRELGISLYLRGTFTYMRSPKALAAFFAGISAFMLLYGGIITFFTILLGETFGVTSFVIGVFLSIMSLFTAVFASQTGRLAGRIAKPKLIIIGFLAYGFSFIMIPFTTSLPNLLLPIAIFGAGHGLNLPALNLIATEIAPVEQRAVVVSLFNTTLRIGQTLGPVLLGMVLLLSDLETVFLFSGAVAILTAVVIFGLASFKIINTTSLQAA